jgi:hypothetical protein
MPNMWMAAGALMAQDLIEATQWGQVVDIQCSKDATHSSRQLMPATVLPARTEGAPPAEEKE